MASRLETLYKRIKKELIESGEVTFYEDSRSMTETLTTKEECLGCFEIIKEVPTLIVAVGGDKNIAYGVFLHEYCHFMQWREDSPLYFNEYLTNIEYKRFKNFFKKLKKIECNMVLDYWRMGKLELSKDELNSLTYRTIQIERDCEDRVIKLLKDAKVSKKYIEEYTQQSNLYLVKYLYQKKHRIWKSTGQTYKKMPKELISMDLLNEINTEHEALIQFEIKKEEG